MKEREIKKRDNASWTSVTEMCHWININSDKRPKNFTQLKKVNYLAPVQSRGSKTANAYAKE